MMARWENGTVKRNDEKQFCLDYDKDGKCFKYYYCQRYDEDGICLDYDNRRFNEKRRYSERQCCYSGMVVQGLNPG
jgi:hypothetical protein